MKITYENNGTPCIEYRVYVREGLGEFDFRSDTPWQVRTPAANYNDYFELDYPTEVGKTYTAVVRMVLPSKIAITSEPQVFVAYANTGPLTNNAVNGVDIVQYGDYMNGYYGRVYGDLIPNIDDMRLAAPGIELYKGSLFAQPPIFGKCAIDGEIYFFTASTVVWTRPDQLYQAGYQALSGDMDGTYISETLKNLSSFKGLVEQGTRIIEKNGFKFKPFLISREWALKYGQALNFLDKFRDSPKNIKYDSFTKLSPYTALNEGIGIDAVYLHSQTGAADFRYGFALASQVDHIWKLIRD